MKLFISIFFITTSILIFSCKANDNKETSIEALNREVEKNATDIVKLDKTTNNGGFMTDSVLTPQPPPDQKEGDKKKQQQVTKPVAPDWDKKIIKTASINLEVKDYNSYYTSLREKVKNLGGYVAQEEQAQSDYKIENSMAIKVPVDQFDNAVMQLTANSVKINERKMSSQDVTTEVVDTRSRMEAKKQVRQRYMDLLNQAKNMTDILSVQSEVNNIQEQIESAAGRIEYLNHSSVFSTINLTYYQVLNAEAKGGDEPKKQSFGEKVKGAFKSGSELISDVFVSLITIWPLLLGAFSLFLLYKKSKKVKSLKIPKIPGA